MISVGTNKEKSRISHNSGVENERENSSEEEEGVEESMGLE